MPNANRQKIKLLKIMEMLRQQTDEDHPLLTNQIVQQLGAIGITCDRRTLYQDIALLDEYGYEIRSRLVGHQKGYYCVNRQFSPAELKILIDAVQAASFVTPQKTEEFIDKIADLGGSHRAELLKSNIVCFNTTKHTNESIYENVSELENALQKQKKASFYYFDRDTDGSKIYRKEKKRYVVDPMALIFNDDNYYLMCWSVKYDGITNYRVDRMDKVSTEEEKVDKKAVIRSRSVARYNAQVFKMYGGPTTNVVLEFDDSLIGVVQDKFGESIKMRRTTSGRCTASVKVQVSPTFWGWLFQFVGEMKILSPEGLVEEYRKRCRKAVEE